MSAGAVRPCPGCDRPTRWFLSGYHHEGYLRWCAEVHCAACGSRFAVELGRCLNEAARASIAAQEGWFGLVLAPADSVDVRVRSVVRQELGLTFAQVLALFRECPQRPVRGLWQEMERLSYLIRRAVPTAEPQVMPLP
ncbi:hypothetical protein Cs7R123_34720 [Catellatospora sp. TT07R-123]|uniref:hypothetical protein n=1 Tax=Catellatospora sp. TT07R-123 TaxID=2733863 RepID=UPI001B202FE8|nr:hypothetical protein [Catellatospora sp. TT07R-123]GHJ46130.1 hypothetical protein Cs7R123_34720 [Catellatospora sp. TT07R-123]